MERNGSEKLTRKALFWGLLVAILCLLIGNCVWAESLALLQDIEIHPMENNKAQLEFMFNGPVEKPKVFSVDEPRSLIVDFPSISSRLPKEFNVKSFDVGAVKSLKVIEAPHKTRVVVALRENVKFHSEVQGNKDVLIIEPDATTIKRPMPNRSQNVFISEGCGCYEITSLDFQRGEKGEARLVFHLSNPGATVDFKQEANRISAHFINACVPERLIRRYDVRDFGTALQEFIVVQKNNTVSVDMMALGEYEKMAYQTDNKFIIEIRKLSNDEKGARSTGPFTGERLSFNFQDIEIRAALQILADFAGFNLIACDSIQGNITLRLQDVPWDQALDIILKCKQLGKRQFGKVMLVGPSEELIERERRELESMQQVDSLEPLHSEQIQINYAKAKDISILLKEKGNNFMSTRGNVTYDERTNMLLVQDTITRISEIKGLISKLDIPVSQVEIASQIVTADENLEEMLGVKFGGGVDLRLGKKMLGVGSTNERARAIADFPGNRVPPSNATIPSGPITSSGAGSIFPFPTVATTEGLFADLPVSPTVAGLNPGKLALALARLPNGMLVDLELQALEFESKIKTISRPKITTTNKTKAYVEQGFEVPFQEASSSGATSTSFKKAVLRLEVTPQITPDGKIIMDLVIQNDTIDNTNTVTQQGSTSSTIKTSHLETQVLVDNGETIVLGGVLTITDSKTRSKIPFFGDLPFVGVMFRNRHIQEQRKEVLIFITPRIVKPNEC